MWRGLLFVWIAAAMVGGFVWAPLVPVLGDTTRVFYFHFPCALVTVIALAWSMVHSMLYLARRDLRHDDHASVAAELGILFCVGATISGAMWAKAMWGSYWNWDPRETSIFFLLLIYGAYLALRTSIESVERRARLSAVYSAVAFISVPFLIFIVPRIYDTLHPDPIINARGKPDIDGRIMLIAAAMFVGFTGLFAWLLRLRVRLTRIERRLFETRAAGPAAQGSEP